MSFIRIPTLLLSTALLSLSAPLAMNAISQPPTAMLTQKPTFVIKFPRETKSPLSKEAGAFLNLSNIKDKTYEESLKAIDQMDRSLVKDGKALPGAFTNACAQIFSNASVDPQSFSTLSESEKTTAMIKANEELLAFAKALDAHAQELSRDPELLGDRLASLEKALAEKKASGQALKEVVIYVNDPGDKTTYEKVVTQYPETKFIYREYPDNYQDFLVTAGAVTAGLIFFNYLPRNYPPVYDNHWHSHFKKYKSHNTPIYYSQYNLIKTHDSPKKRPSVPKAALLAAPALTAPVVAAKPEIKKQRKYRHKEAIRPNRQQEVVKTQPKVKEYKRKAESPKRVAREQRHNFKSPKPIIAERKKGGETTSLKPMRDKHEHRDLRGIKRRDKNN